MRGEKQCYAFLQKKRCLIFSRVRLIALNTLLKHKVKFREHMLKRLTVLYSNTVSPEIHY